MHIRGHKEQIASLVVAIIAVLVIVGGYASFSGLASYDPPLKLEMAKKSFLAGDVFDANLVVSPVTLMSDESIIIYLDNIAVGAIAVKRYLNDNGIDFGTQNENAGRNNIDIINLKHKLSINLADYVNLDSVLPGGTHKIRAEFSRGNAVAEEVFFVG